MTTPDPHVLLAQAEALAEKAAPGGRTYLDGMVWDQLEDGRPLGMMDRLFA